MASASVSAKTLPTPVEHLAALDSARAELWLKNDGLSHPLYGGNKVRKAERLLAEAERRGASRLLTFGAVGSHHVLTLTLFARAEGKRVAAVLIPQPRTDHAERTLRAALAAGLEPHPAAHPVLVPWAFSRAFARGDYVVPPGGSNALGAAAYSDAVDELALQVESGLLPAPDWIVVPLGSGGTAAGILAGVVRRRLPCRVLAVEVVGGLGPRAAVRYLAARALGDAATRVSRRELLSAITFDAEQVGAGYGFATSSGQRATAIAREHGLLLEPTYTAKAFAAALELVAHPQRRGSLPGRPLRILYWHTFAANPAPDVAFAEAPGAALPPALDRLLR